MNMQRTRDALRYYTFASDLFDAWFDARLVIASPDEFAAAMAVVEELAAQVGYAFGLDTSDRNSLETCRQCVRPGPWLSAAIARLEAQP